MRQVCTAASIHPSPRPRGAHPSTTGWLEQRLRALRCEEAEEAKRLTVDCDLAAPCSLPGRADFLKLSLASLAQVKMHDLYEEESGFLRCKQDFYTMAGSDGGWDHTTWTSFHEERKWMDEAQEATYKGLDYETPTVRDPGDRWRMNGLWRQLCTKAPEIKLTCSFVPAVSPPAAGS